MSMSKAIKSRYSKQRAAIKTAFYALKKRGEESGSYKQTPQYKKNIKNEASALYRLRNKDAIAAKRKIKREGADKSLGMKTVTLASGPASQVFRGGKNSAYYSLLEMLIVDRKFYGFIKFIRNNAGKPTHADGLPTIRNPQYSLGAHFSKVREVLDFIIANTEYDYLFFNVFVTIILSYNKQKAILTHTFDFTEISEKNDEEGSDA